MSIESYNLIEHYDYIERRVPQPFYINSDSFVEFKKVDECYSIKTKRFEYALTNTAAKKLVSALGIKIKLFNDDSAEESCVIDQVMPAVNKLFKCFADCFVFYADNSMPLDIIDLNVNNVHGAEGTKYENGPSPWKLDIKTQADRFTCFSRFLDRYCIDDHSNIKVKADEILTNNTNVLMCLFKDIKNPTMQPMIVFSGKSTNMNGFTDIKPAIYDVNSDVTIVFPTNYAKLDSPSFDDLWFKTMHLFESVDVNDYVSREINEIAVSNEVPSAIKSFASSLLVDGIVNINQPINLMLAECKSITTSMKPGKAKRIKQQFGMLLGWCLCMRHFGCHECGHVSN